MAVEMIAPNGAKVQAAEAHVEALLSMGFAKARQDKDKAAPKKAAKPKE